VRQVFNELSEVAAFGRNEKVPDYLAAMAWVKDADDLLATGDTELNQARGQRLLDQAELFTKFENGKSVPPVQLTGGESALFNVNPDTNTFAGYVLGNTIKGLARALGSERNEYLYFHASIAVKQAQKEALYGNLSGFNAFIQSAYSVIDFTEGLGEGVLSVAASSVDGVIQLVSHPIDSAVAIYTAISNLDATKTIVMNAVRTKAAESLTWGPREAGIFQAELLTTIVSSAYSAGHIVGAATKLEIAQKLSTLAGSIDFLPAMKGYLKLRKVYSRVDSAVPELTAAGPLTLANFADASDEFMGVLGRKLENRELTVGMASHMSLFENGAVRILLESDMKFYPSGTTLKSARGTSEQIFVFPKEKLSEVLAKTQGGNAAEMERILGYDPGSLVGQRLVALEIPMDWKYNPWLATGWEKAANRHFRYGGYTSGGLPELRMEKVSVDDTKRIDLGLFK
jgi:hypothetical protein